MQRETLLWLGERKPLGSAHIQGTREARRALGVRARGESRRCPTAPARSGITRLLATGKE